MLALVVLEGIVLAALAVLVVGLLRSHAEILRRLHDLGAGDDGHDGRGGRVPIGGGSTPVAIRTQPGVPEPHSIGGAFVDAVDIAGITPAGDAAVVGVSGGERTTLLAFLSSGCLTCADIWSALRDPGSIARLDRAARLVIVTKGTDGESPSAVSKLAPTWCTTVMSSAAWDQYEVPGSPYFVLAAGGRVVGEGAAGTWDAVADLLGRAAADVGLDPGDRLDRGFTQRLRDTDDELTAAGITPGHPSLWPDRDVPPASR